MKRFLALGLLCLSATAFAEITRYVLSDDGTALRYETSDGRTVAVKPLVDQVGFTQARLSADRKRLGWVALFPNCCTSYPAPLKLVITSENGSIVSFSGSQAIFKWNFAKGSKAVVYRQEALHGPAVATYSMGRLKDGKILKTFVDAPAEAPGANPAGPPPWVAGASDEALLSENQKREDHD
jgi:hypothetical protein